MVIVSCLGFSSYCLSLLFLHFLFIIIIFSLSFWPFSLTVLLEKKINLVVGDFVLNFASYNFNFICVYVCVCVALYYSALGSFSLLL